MTSEQHNHFNAYFHEAQLKYAEQLGTEIIASIRRMGLITFRIAMILSALRIMEDGCFEPQLVCLDIDFHTALAITDVLLQHTAKVFNELPKADSASNGTGQKTVRRQMFLDKLPTEFDRQKFIEVSASLGIPLSTAERNIKKWCDEGLLIHLEQGKYRKI